MNRYVRRYLSEAIEEEFMYTAKNILKRWGKTDQADQRRLKLKYFSGLSERKFADDFVGFLAREFELTDKKPVTEETPGG